MECGMAVVTVRNISKHFGKLAAVADVSFEVAPGQCFGLLGPNGAGKTTLMKMLYGRCLRDKDCPGSIDVFGHDPGLDELSIKYVSGVVPQDNNLDDELDVTTNLWVYSKFYGLPGEVARQRIATLLEFLELSEKARAKIRQLSGGMQRRLVIARALLNNPRLLILDEPTTGLDPQVRHLIWDKLRQLRTQGTTILLTTHYMEEAFQICDSLLIMDKGHAVLRGSPHTLIQETIEPYVLEWINGEESADLAAVQVPPDVRVDHAQGVTRFYGGRLEPLESMARTLKGAHYHLRQSNLEDVFLKATGRGLHDSQ
jgi:lipooligosaccharide transport system ATP-binding protein